ncbi:MULTISPECIES: hypothetical protein [Streptococcus]|jgi:hypothetical protein|uniref:hypothetical protein n=1 Tax=Streptococcus TaxID=1301 RepID=UPI0007839564|nr:MULTISPECIES: hypothetical protein [Streptococcus]
MVMFRDLAAKGVKVAIKFIVDLVTDYLKSEEFKKHMKLLVEILATKMVDIVLAEKQQTNN